MPVRLNLGLSLCLTLVLLAVNMARADDIAPLSSGASPLIQVRASSGRAASASLFAGTQDGSLFAPLPERARLEPRGVEPPVSPQGDAVDELLSLIAQAEAGRDGYNAVQHGARIGTPALPTRMTLGDIYAWIEATPGQPHAIGRYQFIPPTLRRVARTRGYGPETPFSPAVQDSLAVVLLEEAGLRRFETGEISRTQFMHNLARIWAGLPLPNGRSYYHGYAGNRASMTWEVFSGGMDRIWPRG